MTPRVPDRGQIVVMNFDPQAGSEIGKRRPALVVSPKAYNRVTGFALVCTITTKPRGYPFEVTVDTVKTTGVILADRLRSFDWRAHQCALIEKAPAGVLEEVRARLLPLIE